MKRINSLLSAGVTLTSSGTAVAAPIPLDSAGYFPRFVRVVATGAGCFVKVGDIGVTAVSGDCMIQPLDGTVLNVRGCKAISAISVSGTSSVTVVPLEAGSWNYDQRTLDYNFTTLSAVPSTVTFTRGSSATYFGSDGLLKVQGYNLLTWSTDPSNGTWAKFSSSFGAASSDPFGGTTAYKLIEAAANATHYFQHSSVTITTATAYVFSLYVKAAERNIVTVQADASGGFLGSASTYLLSGSGSVINAGSTTNTISSVGNGWYRITISTTSTGTSATPGLGIRQTSGSGFETYLGDGVSGVIVCGAQLEAGSTATQYSPTTTAANSAPRLDYDPVTLLPRGLLVEEQRTNNETNGIPFNKNVVGDSVTQNIVGPDGVSNSAWTVTSDGTSAAHVVWQAVATPTSGNTYAISVFLKAGTQSLVQIGTGNTHSGATVYLNVNLSTGAKSAGAGIVSGSDFITSIGGGWYRCGFTYVASATASGATVITCPITSISDTRAPTNTLATTYYRFGGQYESTTGMGSATFVTSYIPTTTASATRSADSALMNNTNFSSWYNQSAGTFVVEGDLLQTPSAAARYVNVAGTGVLDAYIATSRIFQAKVNATFPGTANTATVGANFKMAVAYDATGNSVVGNGGSVAGDASFPSANTALWIGSAGAGSNFANSHIRRIQYYPTRLPNATLQTLTA